MFINDTPFDDPDYYRRAKRAVMNKISWGDSGVHDPSRAFYGTDPKHGKTRHVGRILPLTLVDRLIEEQRANLEDEQSRRDLPKIPTGKVMGQTPVAR